MSDIDTTTPSTDEPADQDDSVDSVDSPDSPDSPDSVDTPDEAAPDEVRDVAEPETAHHSDRRGDLREIKRAFFKGEFHSNKKRAGSGAGTLPAPLPAAHTIRGSRYSPHSWRSTSIISCSVQ